MTRNKALFFSQVCNKISHKCTVESSVSIAADFFPISKNGDNCTLRRFCSQCSHHRRISADAVIMAISTDHAAIKSQVAGFKRWYKFNICTDKIFFCNSVFLIQKAHHIQFKNLISFIIANRTAANKNIEVLSLNGLHHWFMHLLISQMRQQIGHGKHRITRLFAEANIHLRTVFPADSAMHCQGNGCPLILFKAPIIVRFKKCQIIFFIKRMGL